MILNQLLKTLKEYIIKEFTISYHFTICEEFDKFKYRLNGSDKSKKFSDKFGWKYVQMKNPLRMEIL